MHLIIHILNSYFDHTNSLFSIFLFLYWISSRTKMISNYDTPSVKVVLLHIC